MSYFNYLPATYYQIGNGGNVLVRNILTRGKIHEFLRETASSALEYTIRDEEKPETLAARVYKRPDYHWIILLFNEIHDPFFKWPLSINELEKHLAETYKGQALFIDVFNIFDIDSGNLLDKKYTHFDVGDRIERRDREGNVVATATVISWDPSFYKLVVDDVVGSFTTNTNSSGTDLLYSKTKTGKRISAPIARVTTENQYALHHFENENGEVISPLYRPRRLENGKVLEQPGRIIDRYVFYNNEILDMGVDAEGNSVGRAVIVTNIQYEERNNDSKRKIRVMRPEMIDPLLADFRKLFLASGA